MKDFKLNPGSKEKNTLGIFNEKQSDTLSRLNPKRKFSRKERKTNKANELKYQNYLKTSKETYSNFDQKKDTVVSTRGHVLDATIRAVHSFATKGVDSGFGNLKNPNVQNISRDPKNGNIIMKTMIRKKNKK